MYFITKEAAALANSKQYESQTLKIDCRFSCHGRDLGAEATGIMVVALSETFESIKESIIQYFEYVSATLRLVSLGVVWCGRRYICLDQGNITSRLLKMKIVENQKGMKLPHMIVADFRDTANDKTACRQLQFLTHGAVATKNSGDFESQILEINCHFTYVGYDLGIEENGVMVVALREKLQSIRDSVLEQFRHLNPRPSEVDLRVYWSGVCTPPLWDSLPYGEDQKCRLLTSSNVNDWLGHWKKTGSVSVNSRNRIEAALRCPIYDMRKVAGGPMAGGAHPRVQEEDWTKRSYTGKGESQTGPPSKSGVLLDRLGNSGCETLLPSQGVRTLRQPKLQDKSAESKKAKMQRKPAASYREGEVIGSNARELSPTNRGRRLFEKMSGAQAGPIVQPVVQVMKTSKAGLGAGVGRGSAHHRHDAGLPSSNVTGLKNFHRHDPVLPPSDDTNLETSHSGTKSSTKQEPDSGTSSDDNVSFQPEISIESEQGRQQEVVDWYTVGMMELRLQEQGDGVANWW